MRFLRTAVGLTILLYGALAGAASKVSVQFHWKHQFENAGLYAAQAQGYYQEAGLDVSFHEYDLKLDIAKEVSEGRRSFGIRDSDIFRDRLRGAPVVLVANYFKRSPLVIATRPEIRLPSDLKGRRLMAERKDFDSVSLGLMLRQFDVHASDVKLVPHKFDVDDFIAGKVDAVTVFLTNQVHDLRRAGIAYNIIDPANYGPELYNVNLFTSERYAREQPDTVRAFRDATNRGWVYALDHPEEIIDLILRQYNTQRKSREALQFEAREVAKIMLREAYPIGSIDPDKLRRIAGLLAQSGQIESLERLPGTVFDQQSPVAAAPATPVARAAPVDFQQQATALANTVSALVWNLDADATRPILRNSFETPDLVAIEIRDRGDRIFQAMWRGEDGVLASSDKQSVPETVLRRANLKIVRPLRNDSQEFAQLVIHLRPKTAQVKLTAEESAFLAAHPLIRVSNETDYPPLDFAVGGQPTGYSVDLLNLLAPRLGLRIEYVSGPPWSELVELHRRGKLDLLQSLIRTPQREQAGLFSEPYAQIKSVFITQRRHADIASFEQLQGKTVAVGKGFALEEFLRKNHPGIRLFVVDNVEQMLDAVANGEADATVEGDSIFSYWANKKGIADLKTSGWARDFDGGKPQSFHFYARKEMPQLISLLNKGLATLTPGEVQALRHKWLGASEQAGTAVRAALAPEQQAYLSAKGVIRMCVDPDWMPIERITRDGAHEGMTADLMAVFAERLGVRIELVPTRTWQESLDGARSRRCDILSAGEDTPSRREFLDFTTPYISFPAVIATKSSRLFISNFETVKHERFGVIKGYAVAEKLKARYPGINLIEVANAREGLTQVQEGKLFGFIDAISTIAYQIQTQGFLDLKISGQLESATELRIPTRKDEPLLREAMQAAIDAVPVSEREAVVQRWLGTRYETVTDYRLLLQILLVVSVLVAAVVFWNRKLAKFNKALSSTQETLSKTSRELQAIVENASIGIFLASGERKIVRMNRHCEEVVFRCPPGAYIGESTRVVFRSDADFADFAAYVIAQNKSSVAVDWTFCRRDGSPFLAHAVGSLVDPADRSQGAIWLVSDISEARAAEERLAQTLKELEVIFQSVDIGIVYSKDRRILRLNRAFCAMLGYTEQELVDQPTRMVYPSDADYEAIGRGYAVMAAGEIFRSEARMRRKDGAILLCEGVGVKIDPNDPSKGDLWTWTDVTELRRAQSQLIQSEKMATLGQLVANVAHEINTPIAAIKSSGENIVDALDHALANLPTVLLRLQDGERALFLRLIGQAGKPAPVRTSREERAQVRAVTGLLETAGGVADANGAARALVQLNAHGAASEFLPLLRHADAPFILETSVNVAAIVGSAANINTAVGRVSKIIFALKSFSRLDSDGEPAEADLREGLETVLTIYHNQIKHGVELVRRYDDIPPLRCLADELNQVWTNLVHNALQAMHYQGTLTVGIRQEQGYAVVSIGDTGAGIPEAIRPRIFDPFFTTKPTGEGSGLGLDIVRKIVEKHHGRIEFDSVVGVGTTFNVYLPYELDET